jgi:hypothetical protein
MATARWRMGGSLLARLAQALGINSVPVAGFVGEGWSPGTGLAIYWVEGVLVIAFISLRILLHRKWTRKRGHFRRGNFGNDQTVKSSGLGSGSLLASYLGVVIPFTFVHGIFLAALLFLFLPKQFGPSAGASLHDLGLGTLGVLFFLVAGFLLDLVGLKERPFRWIELVTERAMSRILIVHLTILFGMFAAMYFHAPSGMFVVFAGLKTLFDLGGAFPHRELTTEPPRWLRFMDKLKMKDGETFSDFWRRTEREQERLRAANEEAIGG